MSGLGVFVSVEHLLTMQRLCMAAGLLFVFCAMLEKAHVFLEVVLFFYRAVNDFLDLVDVPRETQHSVGRILLVLGRSLIPPNPFMRDELISAYEMEDIMFRNALQVIAGVREFTLDEAAELLRTFIVVDGVEHATKYVHARRGYYVDGLGICIPSDDYENRKTYTIETPAVSAVELPTCDSFPLMPIS